MLIGEMLLEEGIITKEQLKDGLEEQKRTGEKIGKILIKMGYISKEILWTFLGYQMGVPYINMEEVPGLKDDVVKMVPEQMARNEKLIPINKQGKVLTIAMSDPLNFLVIDDLKATTRCEIDARLAPEEDIKEFINKHFGFKEEDTGEVARATVNQMDDILSAPMGKRDEDKEDKLKITRSPYGGETEAKTPPPQEQQPAPPPRQQEQPRQEPQPQPQPGPEQQQEPAPPPQAAPQQINKAVMGGDTPVNTFLTKLLSESYDTGATDIHIEPFSETCRIRKRIDGVLYEVDTPPKTLYNGILNKVKELARLNVNERKMPQESKLKIRISGREINMGVHTFPTLFGEKIVLKIIRAESTIHSLSEIGLEDEAMESYKKAISMPHGLILIAGPTNSGKATTMYSTLSELNTPSRNIFSVDDTAEGYVIPGINQTKATRKSYGQVLRYLSDQDCDIIAIGDIINRETAEAVFDIIASGHLVIARIRANDPYQAMQAIVNFGIEPYVVYSNILLVAAQRLVRVICEDCKEAYDAPSDILKQLGGSSSAIVLHKGKGCDSCSGTGYKGRTGVFEILSVTEKIRDMLVNKDSLKKIRDENKKAGLKTLKEAALYKVIQGITTVEEYMKIN